MKLPLTIPGMLLLLVWSCQQTPKKQETAEPELEKAFKPPVLWNTKANGELIDTTMPLESRVYPMARDTAETLDVSALPKFSLYTYIPDSVQYSIANALELWVDTTQTITTTFKERKSPHLRVVELDENGHEIPKPPYIPPYTNVLAHPVFLVNTSDSLQGIESHDGRLLVVQEALSTEGEWKPIERFEFSGCGNSYGLYLLHVGQYLLFGAQQYHGDLKTKMRMVLRTNGKILVSNTFNGRVYQSQMIAGKSQW